MSESTLHVWRIEPGGERFWVIATDEDDARAVLREAGMCDDEPEWCGDGIEQLDDARELKVNDDDGGEATRKTCAEWVASEGRGYLCGDDAEVEAKPTRVLLVVPIEGCSLPDARDRYESGDGRNRARVQSVARRVRVPRAQGRGAKWRQRQPGR